MIKKIITMCCLIFISHAHLSYADEPVDAMAQLDNEIQKHQGKVIYLDFWSSWCVPCRVSFPWMNDIQSKYAEQGFTVISVNLDVEKSFALDFLKDSPASFPVLYDPQSKSARALKVKAMPSSFLLNRQGKIVKGHQGFFADKVSEYESEIEALLAN